MKVPFNNKLLTLLVLTITLGSTAVFADSYEITLTNVTANQSFTPRLAFVHTAGKLFTLGSPALDELAAIAEGGDTSPLMNALAGFPEIIVDVQTGDGLLSPGDSQTLTIEGTPGNLLTLISMLIPTNDGFLGINGVTLPAQGSIVLQATVYDAGTETNDENCMNIPGPVCGGAGESPEDEGEGYIYVHPGIHGIGDLTASSYDWNNPAAIVTITRL